MQQGNIFIQMATYEKKIFMKRGFMVLFVSLLSVNSSFSQAVKSSLLWEISGNGLQAPSYLFGTFHIMCKGDFAVTGVLEAKLKETGQFYGELKMDEPGMQMKMMSKMTMAGTTLQSLLTEKEYTIVSSRFQTITGMSLAMMNHFKPFLPISLLAINSTICKETVQPENEFMSVAQKNKLPILGLETIDDQLNAIDKEPLDSQINDLKKIVMNFDSVKNVMTQLTAVYKLRDVDSLYSFMKATGASEDFETELLDKRNQNWIPVMQKAMGVKPSFFAVGAGHLGGPEGVISLLRKQGYRLTPVKF